MTNSSTFQDSFKRSPAAHSVVLCILDGWGDRAPLSDNAITESPTPLMDQLHRDTPHSLLKTSGEDVGLPRGQMGNSEVGHMNIGAGRVVKQDLPRIDSAIAEGSFKKIPVLKNFVRKLKISGGQVHLLGLVSNGGVHGHQEQMAELALALNEVELPAVVHVIVDGRDTAPQSAKAFITSFLKRLDSKKTDNPIIIGSVSGRYYAMDRDSRWERIQKSYDVLTEAKGRAYANPYDALDASYERGIYDEFVFPSPIGGYTGMNDGDGLVMTNFRADRAREILRALFIDDFKGFKRNKRPNFAAALGMVDYADDLTPFMDSLFPPQTLENTLGSVVSQAGCTQFRIAETEKYPHITYFFNGGAEVPYPGEDRKMIPSPKVATYDLKPEMSAIEVTDALVEAILSQKYDLLVCNYANCDMVGHTGVLEAVKKAAQTVDQCLARVAEAVKRSGSRMMITADHGNAEQMLDETTGQPHTAHTLNPVPVLLFNGPHNCRRLAKGRLSDIAPTLLDLMGLKKPVEMTGQSLINRDED